MLVEFLRVWWVGSFTQRDPLITSVVTPVREMQAMQAQQDEELRAMQAAGTLPPKKKARS